MHADGYAGFEELYRSGRIREVACMAPIRRKFVDVQQSQGSAIAEEAIRRIADLYAVEKEARGAPPDERMRLRQAKAAGDIYNVYKVYKPKKTLLTKWTFAIGGNNGANGNGGAVTVGNTGSITTLNDSATAIFAQSGGGGGNGQITIEVGPDSTVTTNGNGYDTVSLLDGKDNVLTNFGTLGKLGEAQVKTNVVIASGGALTIDNYGLLVGSLTLDGDYLNTVTSYAGSQLKSGLVYDLGTANGSMLTNMGTLFPAGDGTVGSTAPTGDLIQSDTGILAIDLDYAAVKADLVTVTGTADLAGAVAVTISDVDSALPVGNSLTIPTADEGVSNATQSALSVASTAVVAYGLSYPTAEEVVLDYTVDFAVDFAGDGVLSLPRQRGDYPSRCNLGRQLSPEEDF